jgi:hypothetical protein
MAGDRLNNQGVLLTGRMDYEYAPFADDDSIVSDR